MNSYIFDSPATETGFIESLCIALAHRWEPDRLFVAMNLTAYLDESGTHGGSPITVMGGVMANAKQWRKFEKDFRLLKQEHGFKTFHTRKFKKKRGDFLGWSNEQCLRLTLAMDEISRTAFTEAVSMTLDNSDYEEEYRGDNTPRKLRLDSKYGLCFRQCLYFFSLEAMKRQYRGKYPKLHFVLESGHKNAGDAERIFHETQQSFKRNNCNILSGITFADKDGCDPLMMADFIAHTTFAVSLRQQEDGPGVQPRRPIRRGESCVTHLQFKPRGLFDIKADLIEKIKMTRSS